MAKRSERKKSQTKSVFAALNFSLHLEFEFVSFFLLASSPSKKKTVRKGAAARLECVTFVRVIIVVLPLAVVIYEAHIFTDKYGNTSLHIIYNMAIMWQ